MHEITVKIPKGDKVVETTIRVDEPNFEQLRGALVAMELPSGKLDRMAGGNFVIEACIHPEDRDTWGEMKKDPKAQASAALDAHSMLNVYESELKKK
jgi:hypothetical protein